MVEILGVRLEEEGNWPPLATGEEIEDIRIAIENAGIRQSFDVSCDPLGEWTALVKRCKSQGPPHVFHFAGHGLDEGRGLVFRGAEGASEEVDAERLASLLSSSERGRKTQLVFLNACTTSAGPRQLQPFGGLAQRLIQRGIPAVVGFQNPVKDSQARNLAAHFYTALSRGDSVDCALQKARYELFLDAGSNIDWAFATLSISGNPRPFFIQGDAQAVSQPSAEILDFGHEEQRLRLNRFLDRRHPTVVVIHGEARSGHRHVAERVRHDIERRGHDVWLPVPAIHWFVVGEPRVSRQLLAGGIARALYLPEIGAQEALERRIAQEIAERCADDRVVVLDLEEILSLTDEAQADALVLLVQELWSDLMHQALDWRSTLPVYLILSVAYLRTPSAGTHDAERARRQTELTARVIEKIAGKPRLKGQVRVEVLPELKRIEEGYVAEFLENVFDLELDDAARRAAHLVGNNDNETILQRMKQFIEDWRIHE